MIHIPLISPHFSSPPLETPARRLSAPLGAATAGRGGTSPGESLGVAQCQTLQDMGWAAGVTGQSDGKRWENR